MPKHEVEKNAIKISLRKSGETWTPVQDSLSSQSVQNAGIVDAAGAVVNSFLSGIRATFRAGSVTEEISIDA